MTDPLAELSGLGYVFSGSTATRAALDGIDAVIEPGMITGIVGPDAAGKTTLLTKT